MNSHTRDVRNLPGQPIGASDDDLPAEDYPMSGLTPQQAAFVRAMVSRGLSATAAARAAGYGSPKQRAWRLLHQPAILRAIRMEQARLIGGELASVAIGTLLRIMRDETARNADRVAAARLVFEAGQFIGRGVGMPDLAAQVPRGKRIEQMSAAELEEFIETHREGSSQRQT